MRPSLVTEDYRRITLADSRHQAVSTTALSCCATAGLGPRAEGVYDMFFFSFSNLLGILVSKKKELLGILGGKGHQKGKKVYMIRLVAGRSVWHLIEYRSPGKSRPRTVS